MMHGGHQSEPVKSIKSSLPSERARAWAVSKFVSQVAFASDCAFFDASFPRPQPAQHNPAANQPARIHFEFIFTPSAVFSPHLDNR
jgi:hypothetical protein